MLFCYCSGLRAAIADHQAAYGNREEFNSAASTLAEVYVAECDRHAVTAASARRRSGNDSAAGGQRSTRAGSAKKNFVNVCSCDLLKGIKDAMRNRNNFCEGSGLAMSHRNNFSEGCGGAMCHCNNFSE